MPSGENATPITRSVCPLRVRRDASRATDAALLAGVGVAVGGTTVAVGGTGVGVGIVVAVGGTGVEVGGTAVAVGGTRVAVGGAGVAVGVACVVHPISRVPNSNAPTLRRAAKEVTRRDRCIELPPCWGRDDSETPSRHPGATWEHRQVRAGTLSGCGEALLKDVLEPGELLEAIIGRPDAASALSVRTIQRMEAITSITDLPQSADGRGSQARIVT